MSNHNIKPLTNSLKMTSAVSIAVQFDDHHRPMLVAMSLLDPSENLNYFNDIIEIGSIEIRSFIAN